jgi:hypothetical protein
LADSDGLAHPAGFADSGFVDSDRFADAGGLANSDGFKIACIGLVSATWLRYAAYINLYFVRSLFVDRH